MIITLENVDRFSTNRSIWYQTRLRQYISLFAFQQHSACTSARCAQNSSTAAAQKSQLYFSWAMAPNWPELNWTQLITRFGGLQQREYELHVNKLKEIKERLVELWQSSNTTFEGKMQFSFFCVLPGSAKALLRWSGNLRKRSCKKLLKSVEVRRSYSNQRSVFFCDTM